VVNLQNRYQKEEYPKKPKQIPPTLGTNKDSTR
jgi:hypothetical protein